MLQMSRSVFRAAIIRNMMLRERIKITSMNAVVQLCEVTRRDIHCSQPVTEIDQIPGNKVHNITVLLNMSYYPYQHRLTNNRPPLFSKRRPHHHIDKTALIFKCKKGNPCRRHRPLSACDQTTYLGRAFIVDQRKFISALHSEMIQVRSEQRERMAPKGKPVDL